MLLNTLQWCAFPASGIHVSNPCTMNPRSSSRVVTMAYALSEPSPTRLIDSYERHALVDRHAQTRCSCASETHFLVCGRRSEYRPDKLRWPDVEGEALTGKQFILPATDVKGHPVLVLRPR